MTGDIKCIVRPGSRKYLKGLYVDRVDVVDAHTQGDHQQQGLPVWGVGLGVGLCVRLGGLVCVGLMVSVCVGLVVRVRGGL